MIGDWLPTGPSQPMGNPGDPSSGDGGDGSGSSTGNPFTFWGDANASSTMYLFTFLATIVILGGIALVLVLRAAIARRNFRQQIQRAIERGEALPEYQNPFYAPGYGPRRVPTRPLPPIPKLWEDELCLTDERGVGVEEKEKWEWLMPLSISHVHPSTPLPPVTPMAMPPLPSLGEELREAFGDMLPRRPRIRRPRRRNRNRNRNADAPPAEPETPLVTPPVVADPPPAGADVRLGVLIAMPTETPEQWSPEDTEEAEVPEVYFGVMECVVREEIVLDKWGAQ